MRAQYDAGQFPRAERNQHAGSRPNAVLQSQWERIGESLVQWHRQAHVAIKRQSSV